MGRVTGTRITGGSLRGETVKVLEGRRVRPMRSRVREALFAILGASVERAQVLDLFAGSGALGAEAISRGAQRVIYVEKDPRVLRILEENRNRLYLTVQTEVITLDLHQHTPPVSEFDLALCDPPFPDFRAGDPQKDPWKTIDRVAEHCLRDGAKVAFEHPKGIEAPPSDVIAWQAPRRYGETELRIGRRVTAENR